MRSPVIQPRQRLRIIQSQRPKVIIQPRRMIQIHPQKCVIPRRAKHIRLNRRCQIRHRRNRHRPLRIRRPYVVFSLTKVKQPHVSDGSTAVIRIQIMKIVVTLHFHRNHRVQ